MKARWLHVSIPTGALCLALLTGINVRSQPPKTPLARVTVIGKEIGTVVIDDGKKKERYVLLETDRKTNIKVMTDQDVAGLPNQLLELHHKLTSEFMDQTKKHIQANDLEKLKQEQKAFTAASSELLSYLGYYAVDGTLAQVGDELQIVGQLRIVTGKGADKALKKGQALVEGTATQAIGKDKKSLAIANGANQIIVVGKAAEEHATAEGIMRVYGVLRAGEKGTNPVIEAERIEELNKVKGGGP